MKKSSATEQRGEKTFSTRCQGLSHPRETAPVCLPPGSGTGDGQIAPRLKETQAGIASRNKNAPDDGLNATFHLEKDADGALAAKQLLTMLGSAFDAQEAPVGHVKFLLQTHTHQWIGNLTGRLHTASLRQTEHAAEQMTLTVNARVEMPPEALQSTVLQAVQTVFAPFGCRQTALNCLIPGRPNPNYRYEQVIH